jgi:beta-1,4-mannosyltransferase
MLDSILTVVIISFFSLSSYYLIWKRFNNNIGCPFRIAILVVGDLGRSPRMQHHALALAKAYGKSKCEIFLIGTHGTQCREEVENSSCICILRLRYPFIDHLRYHFFFLRITYIDVIMSFFFFRHYFFINQLPFLNIFFYLIKIIELSFAIVYTLLTLPSLHCLIVQNPPAIPALPLVTVYFGRKLILIKCFECN